MDLNRGLGSVDWVLGTVDWVLGTGDLQKKKKSALGSGLYDGKHFVFGPGLKSCECGNNKSRPLLVGKHSNIIIATPTVTTMTTIIIAPQPIHVLMYRCPCPSFLLIFPPLPRPAHHGFRLFFFIVFCFA